MMDAEREFPPEIAADLDRLARAEADATPAQRRAAERSYRAARRAQARSVDPWLLAALREAAEEERREGGRGVRSKQREFRKTPRWGVDNEPVSGYK